ncbi:PTS sugar transporter subunit IIC [Weissella cibaria]|uniref:PTS sugar transporter subunit IIC n=1 Tax=Weissella cibaria TaxID=137591 RepID=UPI0011974F70|nr:PTS sugar transporter subunit IIC [Weissella cibaria]MCS8561612.1 PTS sugar transporter subunit IIC [Weissella cibaria]MCS8564913.1 PTS sugar transporter subunit IIC [Weissella cibaria]MCS8575412.1 PTS sugar transporter subunit IIC [Weissella cibaria]MCS9999474.1 PTS sugar transporter subunit IIC [Weissella cibaria]MDK9677604.1 PTS sugar transporter subunit IIC [Weissella cibaria]
MTSEFFDGSYELKLKDFFFKVLSGSAQGILIGVLPSAVMKYILKMFGTAQWALDFSAILTMFSSFIPVLIGLAIAMQFRMKALDAGVMAIAVGASAGSVKWAMAPAGFVNPVTGVKLTAPANVYIAAGAGDVINAIIVAAVAVLVIWLVSKYLKGFGAVAIILSPIVIGGGVALFGKAIAPYVAYITTWVGDAVRLATDLQPLPMSIAIAMAFSFIIITPISTVGIALAIALSGLGAGAAGAGVVATTVILLINSWKVNKKGTTVAIFLGAMKGMMPAIFKKPIMILSFLVAAAISAIPVAIFNVQGTPTSAGFGWIGMVSPIQSMIADGAERDIVTHTIGAFPALLTWLIVPAVAGFVVDILFTKVFKLYTPADFEQDM